MAVSWKILTAHGHRVTFATPEGRPGEADEVMLTGIGLDPWSRVPGLRRLIVLGAILRANHDARDAYHEMRRSHEFEYPQSWGSVAERDFDGLLLPGGHRARGMRAYLESATLQRLVVAFFASDKPVAAICHGVLLAARSLREDARSVLYGRKTTALTWKLEKTADSIARVSRRWDRDYYRTYPDPPGQPAGYMSVEHEVTRALTAPEDFLDVPADAANHRRKASGTSRDTRTDETPSWVVRDGNYLSARWPGDVHAFARQFAGMLPRD